MVKLLKHYTKPYR